MAQKQTQRKQDIVFLNILFCFLVVFIHVSSEVVLNMDHGRTMYWTVSTLSRLSGFAVYGFILLSGVKLAMKGENMHYGRFYLSRLVSIVLPYIFWVFVYYLYFCYRNVYAFSWWELGRFILSGGLSAQFYFIVVLVQFYMLAPVWMLLFKRSNPAVVLPICLMISIMGGSALSEMLGLLFPSVVFPDIRLLFPRYLFFWAAGCMIGLHYSAFQEYLHRRWLSIMLLFGVTIFLNAWCGIFYPNAAWTEQVNVLYAIAAILFFYMAAQLFADKGAVLLRPFRAIDRSTYGIYLIHCLILFMTNDWINSKGIGDLAVRFGYRALTAYLVSILLCLIWELMLKPLLLRLLKREPADM